MAQLVLRQGPALLAPLSAMFITPHELGFIHAVDLLSGMHVIRQQRIRRLEGGREFEHPLHSFDLQLGRRQIRLLILLYLGFLIRRAS